MRAPATTGQRDRDHRRRTAEPVLSERLSSSPGRPIYSVNGGYRMRSDEGCAPPGERAWHTAGSVLTSILTQFWNSEFGIRAPDSRISTHAFQIPNSHASV